MNFSNPDRAVTFGPLGDGGDMRVALDGNARTRRCSDIERGGIVAIGQELGGKQGGMQGMTRAALVMAEGGEEQERRWR